MNSVQCIIFLLCLSGYSIFTLLFIKILDLFNVFNYQKLIFIKINLIILLTAPFIFWSLNYFFNQTILILLTNQFINTDYSAITPVINKDRNIAWFFYILTAYIIGFSFSLFRIAIGYFKIKKQLQFSDKINLHGESVFLNHGLHNPLSFGLPTAKIYFPSHILSTLSSKEIQMCLTHEKIHVKQNDSSWKLFSLLVQSLLFFSPWIYYLHKRFSLEMEIFCDAKTCQLTCVDINEYGNFLLSMASTQRKNSILSTLTDSTLKRRIIAMKSKTFKRPILLFISCIISLFMGTVTIAMTSKITENRIVYDIVSKFYVDGKMISSPRIVAYANQNAAIVIADKMNRKGNQSMFSGHILKLDLLAAPQGKAIKINYAIQYQNGKEKMREKSQMILNPNQSGVMQTTNNGHTYKIEMLVNQK